MTTESIKRGVAVYTLLWLAVTCLLLPAQLEFEARSLELPVILDFLSNHSTGVLFGLGMIAFLIAACGLQDIGKSIVGAVLILVVPVFYLLKPYEYSIFSASFSISYILLVSYHIYSLLFKGSESYLESTPPVSIEVSEPNSSEIVPLKITNDCKAKKVELSKQVCTHKKRMKRKVSL